MVGGIIAVVAEAGEAASPRGSSRVGAGGGAGAS
jgi:hypothetical protein